MEADGKNRRQLTTGETVDFFPSVSSDGRYIVFVSERTRRRTIWRMDTVGSNQKQLTENGNNPHATADWVVYQANRTLGRCRLTAASVCHLGANMFGAIISPDGKFIGCSLQTPGSNAKLAIIPIEGGTPVKMFDVKFAMPARIRWRPDGRAVTYIAHQNGLPDIWSQPIDGGESKKLTNFKTDRIFSFDWSRDNRLVISHGSATSDVVLISNTE